MATAIKGIIDNGINTQQKGSGVYTLQGVKLGNNADNLKNGLYIINGKKVIVDN